MNKRKIQEVKSMYSKMKTKSVSAKNGQNLDCNTLDSAFFSKIATKLKIAKSENKIMTF